MQHLRMKKNKESEVESLYAIFVSKKGQRIGTINKKRGIQKWTPLLKTRAAAYRLALVRQVSVD